MNKNKKRKSKNFIKTLAWLGVIASPITSSFMIVEYVLKNGTPKPEPVTGYVADSFTYGRWDGSITGNTVEASFVINNLNNNGEPYPLTNHNFGIYMSCRQYGREYAGIITAGEWKFNDGGKIITKTPNIISSGAEQKVTWLPGSVIESPRDHGIAGPIKGKKVIFTYGNDGLETTFKLCIFQENPTENKTWDDTYIFVKDKNGDELSFVEPIIYPCT